MTPWRCSRPRALRTTRASSAVTSRRKITGSGGGIYARLLAGRSHQPGQVLFDTGRVINAGTGLRHLWPDLYFQHGFITRALRHRRQTNTETPERIAVTEARRGPRTAGGHSIGLLRNDA